MVPPPNAPRQDPPMEPEGTKISLFKGREVRKILHQGEWWFVVNDIIETLTDSRDPSQYFKRLKERDEELAKLTDKGGVQCVPPLILCWILKLREGYKRPIVGTPKAFFALFNQSRPPKPSHSSVGWQKSATNECGR